MYLDQIREEKRQRDLRLGKVPAVNVIKRVESHVALPAQEQAEPRSSTAVVIPIRAAQPEPRESLKVRLSELESEARSLFSRIREIRAEVAVADSTPQVIHITAKAVIMHAARFYSVRPSDIKGGLKFKDIVRARHVAMYLAREYAQRSFPHIGRAFGGMDHTTIMNACKRIKAQRAADEKLDNEIKSLVRILREEADIPSLATGGDNGY